MYIKSDDLPFRLASLTPDVGPQKFSLPAVLALACYVRENEANASGREQSLQFLSRLDERKKRMSSEKANERKTAEGEKGEACKDLFKYLSLRASSPIWATEASLAGTRERVAKAINTSVCQLPEDCLSC